MLFQQQKGSNLKEIRSLLFVMDVKSTHFFMIIENIHYIHTYIVILCDNKY